MSKHQVNEIEEATPGAGVTITGLRAPGFKAPQNAFATTAERDAFFAGILTGNELAFNNETGFVERYDAPTAEWRPEGVTGTAGPIVRSRAKGAKGTGAVNDRQALFETDNAVVVAGFAEHDPGVYRIDANLALSNFHKFVRGASLRPNAGVTVTINGEFDAGAYPILDYSLGGTFIFTKQSHFHAEWFNIPTDGTDAGPALTRMSGSIPHNTKVTFKAHTTYTLITPWDAISKKGVTFTSGLDARIPDIGPPEFVYAGAAHGRMINMTRTKNCFFSGFRIVLGGVSSDGSPAGVTNAGADRGLSLNGYLPGDIGTQCTIEYCSFVSLIANDASVQCGIAEDSSGNNQEYHNIRNCTFFGWGDARILYDLSTVAGSNLVSTVSTPFSVYHRGQRLVILGAGPAGAHLVTSVVAVPASNQVQIAVNASTAVVGVKGFLGQSFGTGIQMFPSANVKGINIEHNNINSFNYGIHKNGGSYRMTNNSFYSCELDIWNEGNGEPEYEIGTEVEYSRKHLKFSGLYTHFIMGGRFDVQMILPNTSYFAADYTYLPLESIKTENHQIDGIDATITDAKKFSQANGGLYHFHHCNFELGQTIETLGGGISYGVTVEKCRNFLGTGPELTTLEPSQDFIMQRALYYGRDRPTIRQVLDAFDPSVSGSASVAQIWITQGGGGGHKIAGYRAEWYPVADHQGFFQKIPVGFETWFRDAQLLYYGHPLELVHFRARTATWAAGSVGNPAVEIGFHSEPHWRTVNDKPYGFKQDGVNDLNRYEGRSYLATPNSAPLDADIPPGGYSAYLNEAGNTLSFRVKYTDGVTMKAGTVALV